MDDEHKHKFAGVILAAGNGTRMRSNLPKVLHKIAGRSMLAHVLASVAPLGPEKTVLVVAPQMEAVRAAALAESPDCLMAVQDKQAGTGHAVRCAESRLSDYQGTVLVLYGDTPLLTSGTLGQLLAAKEKDGAAIALLAMRPADATGYGRLVIGDGAYVERIVECKDASAEEKKIEWVWGGVMAFDADFLRSALPMLQASPVTKEYYLTALIEMATSQGLHTLMVPMPVEEAMGINDRMQLAQAERVMQGRLRRKAMENGVTLIDPDTVFLSMDTHIGRDVTIQPNVVCGPGVSIADGVEIRAFSHLEGVQVGERAVIGPFARLRPGSVIGEEAFVGNFVEVKQSTLGKGAKASHLSYLGNAQIGDEANIGAGTITCNFDGTGKHETHIGAGAFIGSNSALVAPVSIGEGAMVGAGSVITEDVEAGALSVARGRQVNLAGRALISKNGG